MRGTRSTAYKISFWSVGGTAACVDVDAEAPSRQLQVCRRVVSTLGSLEEKEQDLNLTELLQDVPSKQFEN